MRPRVEQRPTIAVGSAQPVVGAGSVRAERESSRFGPRPHWRGCRCCARSERRSHTALAAQAWECRILGCAAAAAAAAAAARRVGARRTVGGGESFGGAGAADAALFALPVRHQCRFGVLGRAHFAGPRFHASWAGVAGAGDALWHRAALPVLHPRHQQALQSAAALFRPVFCRRTRGAAADGARRARHAASKHHGGVLCEWRAGAV
mmetsp:Transcript_14813/g.43756  ORF Transcript_14813/g.43756 Transcript_14813/m.43756 type:complete len:207 (-) Transcript_14813:1102-1722(-)